MRGDETPDNGTVISESPFDEYDAQYTNSRKRRRVEDRMSQADREHRLWADELLDYFMLKENPADALAAAPPAPANANLNRPIDEKGYTALHWAAAMGDVEVVKDLLRRGANIDVQGKNGRTPLMQAVEFTNSFDLQNMEKLTVQLIRTVNMQDWEGCTVFHHIADTTQRKSKYQCARYYMDCLLNKMTEILSPAEIQRILDCQDQNGDTAITMAARNGARKCVRSLIGRGAAVDTPNNVGETADQLIVQLNHRRQERVGNRQLSSSPFQADSNLYGATIGGAVQPPNSSNGIPIDPLLPNSSMNGTSPTFANGAGHDVYKSDSALSLTTQIMPTLFSKAKDLASTIDQEIAEKDAELAEAERVAAMRRAEIEALKRQAEELKIKEMEQTSGGVQTDEQLEQLLEQLEKECRLLTEQEQNIALKRLIDSEKSKQSALDDETMTDAATSEALMRNHLQNARELLTLSRQRKDLLIQLVQNMSVASGNHQQDSYKRLIQGALDIKEDDIEGMLPDILTELEEWRGLETVGA